MSCPYKYALGVPGQGIHEARFLGIALNDTLLTIALAFVIAYFSGTSFWITLLVLFVLGEYLHLIFGTQTAFLTMLGIRSCA